jgi:hypothetical protein
MKVAVQQFNQLASELAECALQGPCASNLEPDPGRLAVFHEFMKTGIQ